MAWTKCVCMKPFISVLALVLDDSKFFRSKNRNDAKSLLLNLCTVWFIQQLVTNWKRGFYRNVITFNMESDIFSFFLINNGNQKRQDRPTLPQSLRFPLAGIFHTRKHKSNVLTSPKKSCIYGPSESFSMLTTVSPGSSGPRD